MPDYLNFSNPVRNTEQNNWSDTNDDCVSTKLDILDLHVNFSDHIPISICCWCILRQSNCTHSKEFVGTNKMFVPQLRWNRADLEFYRLLTGSRFQSVLQDIINIEKIKYVHPDDITVFSELFASLFWHCSSCLSKSFLPLYFCHVVSIFLSLFFFLA